MAPGSARSITLEFHHWQSHNFYRLYTHSHYFQENSRLISPPTPQLLPPIDLPVHKILHLTENQHFIFESVFQ